MLSRTAFGLLLVLLIPSLGHAYLDPGAGSMLLQIILGGIAGLAVFGRLFWRKLKAAISTKEKNTPEPKP